MVSSKDMNQITDSDELRYEPLPAVSPGVVLRPVSGTSLPVIEL